MDVRVLSIRQVRDLWTAQSSRSGDAQERPAEDPPSSGLLAPEQLAFIGVPRVEMSAISTPSNAASAVPLARSSGGRSALASDLRVAFLLINEARYRTLERLFGCPKDQANLLTLVAAAVLVGAMRDRSQRIMRGSTPTQDDVLLGMASVRELICSVAGPSLRDMPYLGALITVAFAGRAALPTVIRSICGIRTGSQRLNTGFRRRYGYLLDVGHRRQRRYEALVRKRAVAR